MPRRKKKMEFIIASFRSRAHTIKFYNLLRANGVGVELVNTPKEAGVGCGLSVKFKKEQLSFVKQGVSRVNLPSFAGFFAVKEIGGRRITRPI